MTDMTGGVCSEWIHTNVYETSSGQGKLRNTRSVITILWVPNCRFP